MATKLFAGWLYNNAGTAIAGATVELFPKNTTTTATTSTTTSSAGYWAMTTTTDNQYDVRVTSGSSIRYIKYDTSAQMTSLEAAVLTVDDVVIDGKVITMTGSTDDTAVFTVAANGALSLVTTDTAAAAANIQITADGTAELAGTTVTLDSGGDIELEATNDINVPASVGLTFGDDGEKIEGDGTNLVVESSGTLDINSGGVLTLDSGAAINIEPVAGSAILLDGTISIDGGAVTGVATITMSGELDAGSLDISGDADIDGTANLDAVDIDGAVQIDATFTSGVDGQGYDTKFFGDTASAYMLWDTSADDLILAGAANLSVDSTTASTSTTTGSIHTDGGLGVALDVYVGDDLFLASSGAKIDFNSGDITLTHSSGYLTFDGGTFIVSDGDGLLVGHSALLNVNGFNPKAQILGTGRADGSLSIGVFEAGTSGGQLWLFKSRHGTIGSKSIVLDDDVLGEIRFIGDDGVDYNSSAAIIKAEVDGTPGSNDMPGRLIFLTTPDGSASSAERWRITNVGSLTSLAASPANAATADGGIIATGGLAFTDVANAWIDDGSQGSGTVTHYIGNQSITTSSDIRIKTNIENWVGSALDFFKNAPRLVTFNWDDPTDTSPFGKNHRGTYRGWLAQETIDWAPWIVNAGAGKDCPQCKAGEQCENTSHSDSTQHPMWHVDYQHMVPMMVEGIREFDARLSRLEALMSVSA
jgi:hypothetical protein